MLLFDVEEVKEGNREGLALFVFVVLFAVLCVIVFVHLFLFVIFVGFSGCVFVVFVAGIDDLFSSLVSKSAVAYVYTEFTDES